MGRLDNKVALISGIATGQGRSHAIRLAEEGANILGFDIGSQIDTVPYPMGTVEGLEGTAKAVENLDRRCITGQVDVRDEDALQKFVTEGSAELGGIDIVVANAGISTDVSPAHEISRKWWDDVLDVNLTGVWLTAKAAIPQMIERGTGGSIILTSSARGLSAVENLANYTSAKHGVIGLMRSLALELARHSIRVNSVLPTQVDTGMIMNEKIMKLFCPGVENPTREQFAEVSGALIPLPIPWVEPVDVSNAILWLASDEARYITGVALPVDGGELIR